MNIKSKLKRFRQKYYAPGSPWRRLGKAWQYVRNPGATAARSRVAKSLTDEMPASLRQRVVDLGATGFAYAENEMDPVLLAEMERKAMERLQADGDGAVIRSYFSDLIEKSDLHSDSIFVRFALQPTLLQVASAYFGGKVPYLSGIQLLLSHGKNYTGKWEESQLWHRDYEDSKTIKFWVYLNDVKGIDEGPFTYLPLAASRQVKNSFLPKRVSDEAMEAAGLASAAQQVFGSRLQGFYIDTSGCYHLGSRLKPGHIRYAYVASFVTHAPLYPYENGIVINGQLSEAERLALSA